MPQQVGAAGQMFFFDEIQQPGREETLARGVEQNRGTLFDQRADLIEFGLAEPYRRDWIWCHVRRTSAAAASPRAREEFALPVRTYRSCGPDFFHVLRTAPRPELRERLVQLF